MTWHPRRHGDWISRARRNAEARGEAQPDPDLLPPAPVSITHFGYLNGFKARQEFTRCGLKAKGLARIPDPKHVTCPDCLVGLEQDKEAHAQMYTTCEFCGAEVMRPYTRCRTPCDAKRVELRTATEDPFNLVRR